MIRYAEKQELAIVNELRSQVNEVHVKGRPDIFRDGFCKEFKDYIYKEWDHEKSDIIVAIAKDKICGYAIIEYIKKPSSPYTMAKKYCHINEFGIDEKYRRQKIATELFEFIKAQAKEKNFDRIELDMWEFNETALKFYDSVGFCTYRRFMEYESKS